VFNSFRFALLALSLMAWPALAQDAAAPRTPAQPDAAALPGLRAFERLEGTVSETRDGALVTARLQYQAPDKLRLEIEANAAALAPAQIVVASGDETRWFEPATRRVRRLPYNVAKEPWRSRDLSSGGPANWLLFADLAALKTAYDVQQGIVALDNQRGLRLTARPAVGSFLWREYARFGGTGESAFYAAFQDVVFNRPAEILLLGEGPERALQERDANGQLLLQATLRFTPDGLPLSVEATGDRFDYALKPRTEAFPANAFDLPDAPGQIVEDAELRPLAEYSGGDANALFNRGVALALHTEDYPAAFEAWNAVGLLLPQAVAPPLASFDLAIAARDVAQAQKALAHLEALPGHDEFAVAVRGARLAALRRDWKSAATALEQAQKAQPQNLEIALLRADLLRGQDEYSAAAQVLLDLFKTGAPQPAALAEAAAALAQMSDEKTAATLAATLPSGNALPDGNQWQRLARALLELRANGSTPPPAPTLESPVAIATLAAGSEHAGASDAARAAWQKVAGASPELRATALAHLMALEARGGTAAESLRLYRELIALGGSETEREHARQALLEAWRKNFRQDELRAALEQRALALSAAEEDAKLWLAFQELYGSEADYAAALKAGLTRYSQSAWWQSRRANQLVAQISPQGFSPAAMAARDRLFDDAMAALDAAIRQQPQQPFYPVQRALVLTQRATIRTGIVDASRNVAARRAANAALDALAAQWQDDPDVQLSIALQRLSLETPANFDPIIAQLQASLRAGLPGRDGADRHLFVTAARQALASAFRRQDKVAEAGAQYALLLGAARDASEQSGLAVNYLNLLAGQNDAAGVARLVIRMAREGWEYSEWQESLAPVLGALASRPPLAAQVAALLRASDDPAAPLAAAQLGELLTQAASAEAARPDAPVGADNALAAATRAWNESLNQLSALAQSDDPLSAGRAAAALAETLINQHGGVLSAADATRARTLLQSAVAAEPRDANLRAALAQVLLASGQRDEALAARDALARSLPPTPENLRRAAELSLRLEDAKAAIPLARRALEYAQAEPEAAPAVVQRAAFTLAHALLADHQTAPAMEWYFKLALPQWSLEDRATALLDLQHRLQSAGENTQAAAIEERLRGLKLSDEQLAAAQAAVAGL
jgi:hypothetical protein